MGRGIIWIMVRESWLSFICDAEWDRHPSLVEDAVIRVMWLTSRQVVKCRRATREELQTSHSETYVHMYASSARHRDPAVFGQSLVSVIVKCCRYICLSFFSCLSVYILYCI